MTKLEIQLLLEKAAEETFLDAIELITSKEKEYSRSEFYKKCKIPLSILFEKFIGYHALLQKQESFSDKINDFIRALDTDAIVNFIEEFIEEAEKRQPIVDLLNELVENFNYEKISEQNKELADIINKLKK